MLIMLAAFFLGAFVWPLLRLRLRSGVWGLVSHRGADPCQRLVGVLLAGWLTAVAAWAAAVTWFAGSLHLQAPWPRLGWTLMAAGLIVVVAAQAQMGASWRIGIDDRPTGLVTNGVFALSRNPIYAGMLLALGGVVALSPSPLSALGWVAVAQLVAVQVRLEEQHLLRRHGEEYVRYSRRVGRFWPIGALLRRSA
jgi:protein-S-isoprenylcysteine O-methyltransferase Ste14